MTSDHFYFSDTSFKRLMQRRINKVLVICSKYDFFMLEEDGRIDEQIFNEYVSLNLRYPPVFLHAETVDEARQYLENEDINLIIPMLSIRGADTFQLARDLKREHPSIPIVVLTHFSRDVSARLEREDLSAIDYIFCWLGNSDIFLAIIKMIEDKMNAPFDMLKIGVQAILLIEDSVRFISAYLPNLYRIVLEQSKLFSLEALNEHQQMLRRRGRPKILVATSYKEAVHLFNTYQQNILGVISDVSYKISPQKRDTKSKAGLRFCQYIKKADANLPVLLQSSNQSYRQYAGENNAGFIYKYSRNLSHELKEYILGNFGFGDLVFRDPHTHQEYSRASNLRELQECIEQLPERILEYHAGHDDISKWLNARALFPIARIFKEKDVSDFSSVEGARKFILDGIRSFRTVKARGIIANFNTQQFDEYAEFTRIGDGSLGGKARGLAFMNSILQQERFNEKYPEVNISIPSTLVLTTEVFDEFMNQNNIYEHDLAGMEDDEILKLFVESNFPENYHTDLFSLANMVTRPVAVRSSSRLEDSYYQPFAGVYNTYMIPKVNDPTAFVALIEQAIKSVYASVFFQNSKAYMSATSHVMDEEKMGVIIQTVCGNVYDKWYYPTISGVARSINYYPVPPEKSDDGVVSLAFGLGKQIVEGNTCLRFSPKYPNKLIQLSSPEIALRSTQKEFYALEMDPDAFVPSTIDSVNLEKLRVQSAINHASMPLVSSVYDAQNQVIREGAFVQGPRVITFSSILQHQLIPFAQIINDLLEISRKAFNNHVEIEFAINLDVPAGQPKQFSYLQVRPIVAKHSMVTRIDAALIGKAAIYSDMAMGNGKVENVKTMVFVNPDGYQPAMNRKIAAILDEYNAGMLKQGRSYVLIGPGRWGSSDTMLGIPVKWSQISSAKVIVEVSHDALQTEPSQGTHFFHNLTTLGVGYMTVGTEQTTGFINYPELIEKSKPIYEGLLYIYESPTELDILFDGRKQQGAICL